MFNLSGNTDLIELFVLKFGKLETGDYNIFKFVFSKLSSRSSVLVDCQVKDLYRVSPFCTICFAHEVKHEVIHHFSVFKSCCFRQCWRRWSRCRVWPKLPTLWSGFVQAQGAKLFSSKNLVHQYWISGQSTKCLFGKYVIFLLAQFAIVTFM